MFILIITRTVLWSITQSSNSQRFKTNHYGMKLFIYKISRYKILFSSINMKWRTHKRQSLIDKYVNINNSIRTMLLNIQVSLNIFTQPNISLFFNYMSCIYYMKYSTLFMKRLHVNTDHFQVGHDLVSYITAQCFVIENI